MLRLFVFLISVLMSYFAVYGQQNNLSGVVHYTIQPVEGRVLDLETKQNPRLPMILEQLSLSLEFTSSHAAFTLNRNPTIDKQDMKDAKLFTKVSPGDYYWQDIHAAYRIVNSAPFLEGDYLVVDSFENGWHTGWEITNESKKIAGYTCFKAVRNDLDIIQERKFPIIAWFCPELPFSFGPLKYGGLPGLILELQTYSAIFGAKHITLGKDIEIPPIPEYKLTSSEEAYFKKLHNEILEGRQRRKKQSHAKSINLE